MNIRLLFSATIALSAAVVLADDLPALETVAEVDLAKYSGKWYEIARLPMPYQKQCAANVSATYIPNANGTIRVINRCLADNGSWSEAEGLAKPQNEANSKLSVTFMPKALRWLPIGKAPYWVMALDENYETAMVGQPDRKYLWILSRKPQMDEAVYQAYLKQAQEQGYDLSTLIHTKQF
ncbi:lipocalin family protein [Neisseria zalophi]|uniref:Outer membrane lipoprotein Blc n=1 Tax=Neisseria zalophi TaxID=640030 RepID=A0A5J6Q0M1_9NEIS|nr:lipocalin family protein [Neisseria zalophi]QEY26557.1 hypothetical protein D0T92_08445 [Neisseria zalophi]